MKKSMVSVVVVITTATLLSGAEALWAQATGEDSPVYT